MLLPLEDPSLFVPFMREVVRQPAFADSTSMVEMCLDDAAEVSAQPFAELLEADPEKRTSPDAERLLVEPVVVNVRFWNASYQGFGKGNFMPGGSSVGNGEPPSLPLGGDFGGRPPLGRSSPINSIMSETLL